jgi:heme o synthase
MESAAETARRAAAGAEAAPVRSLQAVDRSWPHRSAGSVLRDYVTLTKPRIISLLLLTTVAAMFVADPSGPALSTLLWTVIGGYLAAGGAGAINHYLERDADARMARTRGRPLASGRIDPIHGLVFGIALGALAVLELGLAVNVLAAALALVGLLGYTLLYTLWLKPLTPQNIVIGGAAGAVPPLVGWAAATGGLDVDALYLFWIVFLWTPPHFWALALMIKNAYAAAGIPMLPVVRGDRETARQILLYSVALVAFTVAVGLWLGPVYTAAAVVLGGILLTLAVLLRRDLSRARAQVLFHYSLAYLALLFVAAAIDPVIT